jgi:hypothetical protein
VHRTVPTRRRRIATASLWFLTISSGTDVATASAIFSSILVVGLVTAILMYADPFHRIWPRRRVTIADLPLLRRDLATPATGSVPQDIRVR